MNYQIFTFYRCYPNCNESKWDNHYLQILRLREQKNEIISCILEESAS